MAEFHSLNRSPFFKTFTTPRAGNVIRNRQHTVQNSDNSMYESGNLQHYPMLKGILTHREIQQLQHPRMRQRQRGQNMSSGPQAIPQINQIQNTLPQHAIQVSNEFSIPQPVPVQQTAEFQAPSMHSQPGPNQIIPPQPQTGPDPSQMVPPQQAAARFQQVNKSLPDGVRFEPLDEETKAALKKLGLTKTENDQPKTETTSTPAAPVAAKTSPKNPETITQTAPKTPPNPPEPLVPAAPAAPLVPAAPAAAPVLSAPYDLASTKPAGPIPMQAPSLPPGPIPMQMPNQVPSQIPGEPQTPKISAALLEKLIQDERNASLFYGHLSEIASESDFQDNLKSISNDCHSRLDRYKQILHNLHDQTYEPEETQINTTIELSKGLELAVIEERKILASMAELIDQLEDRATAITMQNLLNKRMIALNWLQWAMFRMN